MKQALFLLIMITITCSVESQISINQERFDTLAQRTSTHGKCPPQDRFNFYTYRISQFFKSIGWGNDPIISIKEIQVPPGNPLDRPSDRYFFVGIKTKYCSTPLYSLYDIKGRAKDDAFHVVTNHLPNEIPNYFLW
jgi:hypothetical protein